MLAVLRQRNFALVWVAGLVSLTGDWMLLIGLPLYVYRATGSTLATGAMIMVRMAPRLLLGSVAGVFADRWDRKRTMIGADLLLALSLLPLLAVRSVESLWVVYAVSFVESSIAQFFAPAEAALLPRLVGEEHLTAANALNSMNQNISRLAGPPLGGAVVGLLGLTGVALLDAASFLISAALIALVAVSGRAVAATATLGDAPAPSPLHAGTSAGDAAETTNEAAFSGATPAPALAVARWTAVWREWLAGLRLVRRERVVAVVSIFTAMTGVGEGAFGTLLLPFVTKVLGGSGVEYGWVVGAQAIGGIVGSVVIGRFGRDVAPARLLGLGALGLGAIDLLIINYYHFIPGVAPAVALMAIVGIPAAGIGIGFFTLLQTAVADAYRGRIFGAQGTNRALTGLVGAGLAGVLGDLVGIVLVLNVQGAAYLLAGALVLVALRGAIRRPAGEPGAREEAALPG